MQACKDCDYYKPEGKTKDGGDYGYCYLEPPRIVPLPQVVGSPLAKEPQMTIQPASVRPLVRSMDGCSHWKSVVTH